MRSPATDILETALALHRAPGERFRLRGRPLPAGIVHLIEIAGGAPGVLRDAAAELGEPEERVLEASRFYLEQMLFADPGADAYRVLGVAPDAPLEEIRRHHRLLQRWLHPDRAIAGDAAVFATRVNQAWAQLRSPEARAAHDARLAESGSGGAAPADTAPPRRWHDDAPAPPVGRRSRWLTAAAVAACAVLVFLVYRNEQRPPELPADPRPAAAVAAADAARPAQQDTALQEALARALEPAADLLAGVEEAVQPAPVPEPPPPPTPAPMPAPVQLAAPAPARRPVAAPVAPPEAPAIIPVAATPPAPLAPPPAKPGPGPGLDPGRDPDPGTRLMAERLRQAEQRLGQVTAYLASAPDAAPLWNDATTAERAARLRSRFGRHDGCPEFDGEVWRLHLDNAHASAAWRCRSERGRLDVELVWREGMWLVRGLDMAPAA